MGFLLLGDKEQAMQMVGHQLESEGLDGRIVIGNGFPASLYERTQRARFDISLVETALGETKTTESWLAVGSGKGEHIDGLSSVVVVLHATEHGSLRFAPPPYSLKERGLVVFLLHIYSVAEGKGNGFFREGERKKEKKK